MKLTKRLIANRTYEILLDSEVIGTINDRLALKNPKWQALSNSGGAINGYGVKSQTAAIDSLVSNWVNTAQFRN